nr:hypothetical protein 5 [Alphaproteobacteria bacterium]BDD46018.1 hypothetical protein 6 [Pseudomonadaceae bacterium]BDD46435.1 hypothetical protein 5 [bacterium]
MEKQLVALLLSAAGLTTLVPENSIEWGRSSQGGALPRIVLQRIDGIRDYHMQGASGYVASRVQIDVYSERYLTTKTIVDAVRALLSGYRGGIFQGIFLDGERDLPAADAGDVKHLFRTSLDFMIHHKET